MKSRIAEMRDEERKLTETLGDRHPELSSLRERIVALEVDMKAETRAIVRSVEAAYETAVQQEARLGEELAAAKAAAYAQDRTALRSAVLRRDVESRRALLKELTTRAQQTGLESQLRFTNLRIVERAEPPRVPVLPRRAFNYQIALLIGLGWARGSRCWWVGSTTRLRRPTTSLSLALFLGMVPAVAADATLGCPRSPPRESCSPRWPRPTVWFAPTSSSGPRRTGAGS
jgi:hypothetical protein